MRLTLDDDCESISGDDDFFSVARTIPLVAKYVSYVFAVTHAISNTFDSERRDTLVDSIERVLCHER